jgi:hypothetical protein
MVRDDDGDPNGARPASDLRALRARLDPAWSAGEAVPEVQVVVVGSTEEKETIERSGRCRPDARVWSGVEPLGVSLGHANTQVVRMPRNRVESIDGVSVTETDGARERARTVRGGLVKYALDDSAP